MALGFLPGIFLLSAAYALSVSASPVAGNSLPDLLLTELNRFREVGFKCPASSELKTARTLQLNETLNQVAQAYAEKMARLRFLEHGDIETRRFVDSRVRNAKINFEKVGENIQFTVKGDPTESIRSFSSSAAHCGTMLEDRFWDVGFGMARGLVPKKTEAEDPVQKGLEGYYFVQIYIRPIIISGKRY